MEDEEEYQAGAEEIIPIEVYTLDFYGKPLIAVRLPDGRPAVSIRSLCSNMELDRKAQVRRIKRTAPIVGDLVENVMIDLQTGGGPQPSQVLVLRSLAYWLTGIDHKRTRPELQEEILRYQCEAVDALYTWAGQRPRALPAPAAEPQVIEAPGGTSTAIAARPGPGGAVLAPVDEPGPEASARDKAAYHELMSVWHRHQADLHAQAWRGEVEQQLDSLQIQLESEKAITDIIPDILARLGPEKISATHRGQVKGYVKRLHELTGKAYPTIYEDIRLAFGPASYHDLLEAEWSQIEAWFTGQIERASRKNPGR
jgi:hypothetical protein